MKKHLKAFSKVETTKKYELRTNNEIRLYMLKKRASKRTIIHLNNDGSLGATLSFRRNVKTEQRQRNIIETYYRKRNYANSYCSRCAAYGQEFR